MFMTLGQQKSTQEKSIRVLWADWKSCNPHEAFQRGIADGASKTHRMVSERRQNDLFALRVNRIVISAILVLLEGVGAGQESIGSDVCGNS
jgi:hypothetical protein